MKTSSRLQAKSSTSSKQCGKPKVIKVKLNIAVKADAEILSLDEKIREFEERLLNKKLLPQEYLRIEEENYYYFYWSSQYVSNLKKPWEDTFGKDTFELADHIMMWPKPYNKPGTYSDFKEMLEEDVKHAKNTKAKDKTERSNVDQANEDRKEDEQEEEEGSINPPSNASQQIEKELEEIRDNIAAISSDNVSYRKHFDKKIDSLETRLSLMIKEAVTEALRNKTPGKIEG